MRPPKSRSRNKSNRSRSVGNVINRVFESSGPEGKVRGTPQQIIDKFNQLARDAQLSGDRVAAENFQQHAEHYQRLLNTAQKEQEAKREEQERQNRERQAERDRDRARRQERELNGGEPVNVGSGAQPEVLESAAPAPQQESGLVDTPESRGGGAAPQQDKPRRSRKPRKPKADAVPAGDAPDAAAGEGEAAQGGGGSHPPEAAE